jgi:hypothetical protein
MRYTAVKAEQDSASKKIMISGYLGEDSTSQFIHFSVELTDGQMIELRDQITALFHPTKELKEPPVVIVRNPMALGEDALAGSFLHAAPGLTNPLPMGAREPGLHPPVGNESIPQADGDGGDVIAQAIAHDGSNLIENDKDEDWSCCGHPGEKHDGGAGCLVHLNEDDEKGIEYCPIGYCPCRVTVKPCCEQRINPASGR